MENFNLRKFLIENKLTSNSRRLSEETSDDIYYDDKEQGKLSDFGKKTVTSVYKSFNYGDESATVKGSSSKPLIPVMKRYTFQSIQPYLTGTKLLPKTTSHEWYTGFSQIKSHGHTFIHLELDLETPEKGGDAEHNKYKALTVVQNLQKAFGYLAEKFEVSVHSFRTRILIYLSRKWEEESHGKVSLTGKVRDMLIKNGAVPYGAGPVDVTKTKTGYTLEASCFKKLEEAEFEKLKVELVNTFKPFLKKFPIPTVTYTNMPDFTNYKLYFTPEVKTKFN